MVSVVQVIRDRSDLLSRKLPIWVLIAFVLIFIPSFIKPPTMPGNGLEASWVLANEYAFQHHLKYGTEFIFTYGSFAFLMTRLFQPNTFLFVLASDIFLALIYIFPLFRVRELWLLIMYAITMFVGYFPPEATVSAAVFSLFGLSLIYRNWILILVAALFGFIALSKYSIFLVILPLLVVSDVYHLIRGKFVPVFSITFLISLVFLLEANNRFDLNLSQFFVNTFDAISDYSRAMQFEGNPLKIFIYIAAASLAMGAAFVPTVQRPPYRMTNVLPRAFALGTVWYIFITFKMGYVRQDDHVLDSWHSLIYGCVIMFAILRMGSLRTSSVTRPARAILALIGLVVCSTAVIDLRLTMGATRLALVPGYIPSRLWQVANDISSGVEWLDAKRWSSAAAARRAADASLRRTFPDSVSGTVDAIPGDVASLITSGLGYHPRPVLESYSSYSPRLQKLDSAYFDGPRAPETLFLDISDIDGRLPAQAVGPSLPVIGRWYDAVDLDAVGLVLRRRSEPRMMTANNLGGADVELGDWIGVPDYRNGLLLTTFSWPRSLFGKALAFAYREPILTISLKSDSGHEYLYRFVPSMTEAGFVLAPLALGDTRLAALSLLDPQSPKRSVAHIVAFRISGGWFAQSTYPRGHVAFEKIELAPGFSGNNASLLLLTSLYDSASAAQTATGAVWVRGHDLFAHAPTILSAKVTGPSVFRGSIGFANNPAGLKLSDGVRFIISFEAQDHSKLNLFDETLVPKHGPDFGGPQSFSVKVPGPGNLFLETEPVGSTAYDWSMWEGLDLARQSGP
jgi:hypothetical protein